MTKRPCQSRKRGRRPVIQVIPSDAMLFVATFDRLVRQVQALAKPVKCRRRLPPRRVGKRAG